MVDLALVLLVFSVLQENSADIGKLARMLKPQRVIFEPRVFLRVLKLRLGPKDDGRVSEGTRQKTVVANDGVKVLVELELVVAAAKHFDASSSNINVRVELHEVNLRLQI